MTILFSLKISKDDQERFQTNFPKQTFIFCDDMDEAKNYIAEAEVIVTFGSNLDEGLVEQAKCLKWVCVLSAGLDALPFKTLEKKDVVVTNARGIHKTPMAEYAISMLLQVYRHEKTWMEKQKKHEWDQSVMPMEITGKTMLVAGTGAIGQEVARLAKAFQMKTIGVSRSGRALNNFDVNVTTKDMKTYLPEADFIVSVLPSTVETKHLYTFDDFQAMKEEAVFLNMGRGDVVASDVIIKALREGEIRHAILDVFETEPLPKEHPLWDEENVTITPHLSGVSPNYLSRALEIFENNLDVFVQGGRLYINKIDITRGY